MLKQMFRSKLDWLMMPYNFTSQCSRLLIVKEQLCMHLLRINVIEHQNDD